MVDEMPVLFEVIGRTAVITMNRPRQLNALNRAMLAELATAFTRFAHEDELQVAIITGAGDTAFTAGIDLKERAASGEPGLAFPDIRPLANPFWPGRARTLLKPVIAAVNGYAMGGGFFMTLRADYRIAASTAEFEISEIPRGSVAGWEVGYQQVLPLAVWTELAFGSRLSARRAYDAGIINEVVEPGALRDAALTVAERILKVPPVVLRRNLELLRQLAPVVPDELWVAEAAAIEECRRHPDASEAIAAFLERREPVWHERRRETAQ